MIICLRDLQMQLKIHMVKMTVKVLFPYSQNTREAMLRMLLFGLKPVDCRYTSEHYTTNYIYLALIKCH